MKRDAAEVLALERAQREVVKFEANGIPAPAAERMAFRMAHERFSHNLTHRACVRIKKQLRVERPERAASRA